MTLEAVNATLRDVLAEWARVGGFRLLDYDTLDARTVTVQLANVPEREALNILLRDIGGYVLGARRAGDSGRSQFGSLLVVSGNARSPRQGALAPLPPPPPPIPAVAALDQSGAIEEEPQVASIGGNGTGRPPSASAGSSLDVSSGGVAAGPQAAVTGLLGNSGLADVPGPDSTLTPLDQRPPMPLLRPSSAPDAANPFGRVVGSATPGAVVGTASPRILYSPITEQNVGSAPGVSPSASPATAPK